MEFSIVQLENVVNFQASIQSMASSNTLLARLPVEIRPKRQSTCPTDQNIFCSRLQSCLAQISSSTNVRWDEFLLSVEVHVPNVHRRAGSRRCSAAVAVRSPDAACNDDFFSRLIRLFGDKKMFSLDIFVHFSVQGDETTFFIKDVKLPREGLPQMHDVCATYTRRAAFLCNAFHSNSGNGMVSAILKLSDEALSLIHRKSQPDHFSVFGQLLTDQILTDAILVGSNGIEVHCHKNVLAVYSVVFRRMFESSMQESNGRVEILTITERAIRAFLAYLYSCDITELSKSCSVAHELIIMADMYDIPKLLETIQQIIVAKEATWFSTGNLIQLTQLVRKQQSLEGNPGWEQTEKRIVALLRTKSHEEVYACDEFQELFRNRKEGMEFCHYFVQAKQ